MKLLTFLARRYIGGEKIEDNLKIVKKLNNKGILATLDILGEEVTKKEEAEKAVQEYIKLLETIHNNNLQADISLKLSMIGLDIDEKLCKENLKTVLEKAKELDNLVWIDMESSKYTEKTLDLYIEALKTFKNVGIAIQSYLYRSEQDVLKLAKLESHVRLVKGAYKEQKEIAFPKKEEVDQNYRKLMIILLKGKGFIGIATHDLKIIQEAEAFISKERIGKEKYEFQMLYGIRREYWHKLVQNNHPLRIYIPFGPKWLPYMLRRLRERKENFFFLLKHLL